jgi:anti-anti-sigma regulatory factor
MNITRNDQFGQPILRVHSRLTNGTFPDLLLELRRLRQEVHSRVALDLSWVTRMGRAQALLLQDVRDNMARRGVTLSLIGLSPAAIEAMGQAATLRRRQRHSRPRWH